MSKAVLVIDMPSCCDECFALEDRFDYPMCLITYEQKGYNFRTREQKMNKCPLKPLPEEDNDEHLSEWGRGYQGGWNDCINAIYKEQIK